MKNIIKLEDAVYTTAKHTGVYTDTLLIAEVFKRKHFRIVSILERLVKNSGIDNSDIGVITYRDNRNRKQKMYQINRKAFLVIALSFTGADADRLKGKFVDMFMRQEKELEFWKTEREAIKQPTKDRNDSLKDLSDSLITSYPDSTRGARLYQHISQKINIVVFGTANKNREDATRAELHKIDDMEDFTEYMIRFSINKYDSPEDARQRVFYSLKQDPELLE